MNLAPVLTASQLIVNAITSMKYVREAADSSDNLDLKSQINEFSSALLALTERIVTLDQENRDLKETLTLREEVIGPEGPHGYFFFKDKPELPLCPKCFQSGPRNAVFLSPPFKHNGAMVRRCPVCRFGRCEEPAKASEAAFAVGELSLASRTRGYL